MHGQGEETSGRSVLRVSGADRESFLQGLVTNDVRRLKAGIVYAALLGPQGKYLADFFLIPDGDAILIDVATPLAEGLARRLSLYRLRADVRIEPSTLHVRRGLGAPPAGAFSDPRHPALGWRSYGDMPGTAPVIDWEALRVMHLIPESGVDFRKGCYVGQEVTARMKHKTELRKGLAQVEIDGEAAPGTPILTPEGREAGQLLTRSGDRAIAYLRFDRASETMTADAAKVCFSGLQFAPPYLVD